MTKYRIKVPIYNSNLIYIVTNNFLKEGRKLDIEFELDINHNLGLAFRLNKKGSSYVIFIKPKYKKDWSIISHEALHITNFILDDRGIEGSYKNDEAQAYLLSYITKQIQYEIKRKKSIGKRTKNRKK